MNIFDEDSDRHVVPRWRLSKDVARSPEVSPLQHVNISPENYETDIAHRLNDFNKSNNIGTAADLLGTAIIADAEQESKLAAGFILDHEKEAPLPLLSMAKAVLDKSSSPAEIGGVDNVAARIKETKNLLSLNARSAALWSDLARYHTVLGQDSKAERAMSVALQLAPNSRWVLRSAVRMWLHFGTVDNHRKEYAHSLLVRSHLTKHDPWLMASELATAQIVERSPKYWKQAKALSSNANINPLFRSELAAAIATIEMADGNNKLAKRFFQQSLQAPTENVLAQAKWAESRIGKSFDIIEKVRKTPDAFEACFRQRFMDGRILSSFQTVEDWLSDEPFSYMPTSMKCYVACLLDDYDTAISTIDSFKARGEEDHGLLNNRDFAQLSKGAVLEDPIELFKIKTHIEKRIQTRGPDLTHALANAGLYHYRIGDNEQGKVFYEYALTNSINSNEAKQSAAVVMFHAKEAIIAHAPWAEEVFKDAISLADKSKNEQVSYYIKKIEAAHKAPSESEKIFSKESANRFEPKKTNKITIERTPSGDIITVHNPKSPKRLG